MGLLRERYARIKEGTSAVLFDATSSGNLRVSAKAFAEVLKDWADATQILGSETGTVEGRLYSLFLGDLFQWCAHGDGPQA